MDSSIIEDIPPSLRPRRVKFQSIIGIYLKITPFFFGSLVRMFKLAIDDHFLQQPFANYGRAAVFNTGPSRRPRDPLVFGPAGHGESQDEHQSRYPKIYYHPSDLLKWVSPAGQCLRPFSQAAGSGLSTRCPWPALRNGRIPRLHIVVNVNICSLINQYNIN